MRSTLLTLAILATAGTTPALAAGYDLGPMHIEQPWARATPKGASVGGAYLSVTNHGTAPDRLTCVSADISAKCEIHSMEMDGGVMKMRPVQGGVEIKPGETVAFKPGSYHLMLLDLKGQIEQGHDIKVTLKFEHAGTIDIPVPVQPVGATAPADHMQMH